ncbi:uncharacterized protein F4822DRAFT_432907 [Hypoxylon trugodes]|uniref:uncharacterized protein n=1 Tax=Hypoxylon trugodes TaxID=326681 RepID=UPI002198B67A|nr:uncharacterized protein F4822DRAFT_432907 [Hypoxylon trugodes]KAI1384361.1 hypothetical protein F4822DRAFT_432907 [Hypoxylon trugodes]
MLLHHPFRRSWDDVNVVEGIRYDTYREAYEACGRHHPPRDHGYYTLPVAEEDEPEECDVDDMNPGLGDTWLGGSLEALRAYGDNEDGNLTYLLYDPNTPEGQSPSHETSSPQVSKRYSVVEERNYPIRNPRTTIAQIHHHLLATRIHRMGNRPSSLNPVHQHLLETSSYPVRYNQQDDLREEGMEHLHTLFEQVSRPVESYCREDLEWGNDDDKLDIYMESFDKKMSDVATTITNLISNQVKAVKYTNQRIDNLCIDAASLQHTVESLGRKVESAASKTAHRSLEEEVGRLKTQVKCLVERLGDIYTANPNTTPTLPTMPVISDSSSESSMDSHDTPRGTTNRFFNMFAPDGRQDSRKRSSPSSGNELNKR